ncbi:MAG TPA: hypothetical protein DCF33_13935, partial [Saprospirales bacterium]|nr:hypothetical protein [Saprospirales bacterium]
SYKKLESSFTIHKTSKTGCTTKQVQSMPKKSWILKEQAVWMNGVTPGGVTGFFRVYGNKDNL